MNYTCWFLQASLRPALATFQPIQSFPTHETKLEYINTRLYKKFYFVIKTQTTGQDELECQEI